MIQLSTYGIVLLVLFVFTSNRYKQISETYSADTRVYGNTLEFIELYSNIHNAMVYVMLYKLPYRISYHNNHKSYLELRNEATQLFVSKLVFHTRIYTPIGDNN